MPKMTLKKDSSLITTFDGVKHKLSDILEKMKDDDFYYGYLTKQALSCSLLKILLKSPKQYIDLIENGQDETQPLRDGRLFHLSVLEPEKFSSLNTVDVKSKNTKAYKAAVEEHGTVYTAIEMEKAEILSEVLANNSEASLMIEGGAFEVPAIKMIDGIPFRGKADILKGNRIIDLKTTMDIKKFKYSAYKYGYDLQAYLYLLMFPEAEIFTFLCIDKATKDIAVYECSEEFLESGRKKLEQGIAEYNFFFDGDVEIENYIHRDIL